MILVVSVADVCRAPLAAALVQTALAEAGVATELQSAGTQARAGEPVDEATRAIATQFGCARLDHRARQLDAALVAEADLVLTATRDIRSDVVQLHLPAVQYAFTIRQLDRILTSGEPTFEAPGGPPHDIVLALRAFAGRNRSRALARTPEADDLTDPYGRPRAVHEQVAGQMNAGLGALVAALGGTLPTWPRWH